MAAIDIEFDAKEVLGRLDRVMSTDPKMRRQLVSLVRDAVREARKEVRAAGRAAIMADPRGAVNAVRMSVYRKIIGANVNILPGRGSAKTREWEPKRRLRPGQWGGNRRPRSGRTEQMQSYWGPSRDFALRFVNSGTAERHTIYGNRGAISARDWFAPAGRRGMERAAQTLAGYVERAIREVWT